MASLEAALIAALKADAGVAALAGARVFIVGGQQGVAYPYVTIQRISTQGASHLDGPSNLDWPRIQIDCWGNDALSALNTSEAVRHAIDGVPQLSLGINFDASFQDQRGPQPDEESRSFRVLADYLIFYGRN